MKIATLRQAFGRTLFNLRTGSVAAMILMTLASTSLFASTTVVRLAGNATAGYVDGPTTAAVFHTPVGLALDEDDDFLFVADQSNNAVRVLDLENGYTATFVATNLLSQPVGVALDGDDNVYVLNRGKGTNGTVLEFDTWGDLLATNAMKLTNAAAIALDPAGNIYVTKSNALIQISSSINTTIPTNVAVIATITNAGTSLQGLVVRQSGLIAVCDSGNSTIWDIDPNNPTNGNPTKIAGFNGAGDYNTNAYNQEVGTPVALAKFNQPHGIAEAGDGSLIIADFGNNKIKVLNTSGIVTNLYGISSNYWGKTYPGFQDGIVAVPDAVGGVAARLPNGLVFGSDGSVYVTEDYYNFIRKATTGLPKPPAPLPPVPPPPTPVIGWFDYEGNNVDGFFSVLHPVTQLVFHNDTLIAINPGTNGVQTYYTAGPTPDFGSPGPTNGSTPPFYQDGLSFAQPLPVTTVPDLTIKAVNFNIASQSSTIVQARFQFVVGNPTVTGNNAAQFTLSDITTNVTFFYTIDGTDPTNAPPNQQIASTNGNPATVSLNLGTNNIFFQARAVRSGYQTSGIAVQNFSPGSFVPNSISFGFASGEASSDFVASPGQTFYAPVTLSILPSTTIYSLQFNLTVTNLGSVPITPGAFSFESFLEKPLPSNPKIFEYIPPLMFSGDAINPPPADQIVIYDGLPFINLETTNLSENLLGVGWLERATEKNLYDTTAQTLISFSQAHDVQFLSGNGLVEVGGYAFQVPTNAVPGQDVYQIQIARPSATSDGIGAPGSSVFIFTPTAGSLGAGAINSIKDVTVGQRKYIVGDAYPFRWFNAGDFGNTNLENADVEQVFQSAVYGLNSPAFAAPGSDFFDAMDSCGNIGVLDSVNGYYTNANTAPLSTGQLNNLFDGNDTTINQIIFGDGTLDVSDVYVTFRRSLDPSLIWYNRFWTNGMRVAETTANVFSPSALSKSLVVSKTVSKAVSSPSSSSTSITNQPKVNFFGTDFQTSAGHIVHIPITAQVFGNYPLRVLMLNLSVVPLDGSPILTTPIQFTPNSALGSPTLTDSTGNGNYAAAWLNSAISGLTGSAPIGTLAVTIPTNATSQSSYAVHFDHASASPNGLASFPKQTLTGLITLAPRTASSYGDGIPDSWRLRYFGTVYNLLSVSNASPSGDGVSNWKKYVAGVDPNTPNDFPGLSPNTPPPSGAAMSIYWPTVSGKQYAILSSASLFPGSWTTNAIITGNGNNMEFDDSSAGTKKFYRVLIAP